MDVEKNDLTSPVSGTDEAPKDDKATIKFSRFVSEKAESSCVGELETGKFGTYCSYGLIMGGMIASIVAQKLSSDIDRDYWLNDCPDGFEDSCLANGAVLRFSFALTIIFALQFIGTTVSTKFFDSLWIVKTIVFISFVIGFWNSKAEVFDTNGYVWVARITGFFFLVLQQLILIDWAYMLNGKLVSLSEDGTKTIWLVVIVGASFLLLAGSFTAIGCMYWKFGGCTSNDVIISLTLFLIILFLCFQIFFSIDGNLLTSGIMAAYIVYICYSAISLNPNAACNPMLDTDKSNQALTEAFGMTVMVISLTYATYNTVSKVQENVGNNDEQNGFLRSILQEISIVFILISGYYAMVLTQWGNLNSNIGNLDPKLGSTAMWLQASGQWLVVMLYLWSLIAPRLYPDRDWS